MEITIKELEHKDAELIVEYWYSLTYFELLKFGADKTKFLKPIDWTQRLKDEIDKTIEHKQFYYLLWYLDNVPIGHSNIDQIKFGETAFMHLHLWKSDFRKNHLGFQFLQKTIPIYFKTFELKKLYCEPKSDNKAPNRVLEKLGFEFIKQSKKVPNWITFHQEVNEYILNRNESIEER